MLTSNLGITGIAFNSKANYLVTIASSANTSSQTAGVVAFQTLTPAGSSLGSGFFTPTGTNYNTNYPTNLAYNPINGFFAVGIASNQSGSYGAIQYVAISGSTATLETSGFNSTSFYAPSSIVALPSGNIVVADRSKVYNFNENGYLYDSITQNSTALAVDTLRGNILSENISGQNDSAVSGGIIAVSPIGNTIVPTAAFTQPSNSAMSVFFNAFAYNQAEDELYLFSEGSLVQTGISGSSIYSGGTSTSNLQTNAFSTLYYPTQAVVIP